MHYDRASHATCHRRPAAGRAGVLERRPLQWDDACAARLAHRPSRRPHTPAPGGTRPALRATPGLVSAPRGRAARSRDPAAVCAGGTATTGVTVRAAGPPTTG